MVLERAVGWSETPVFHSAVLIFYDKQNDLFLLEDRPNSNESLGGQVVFPSEKGVGNDIAETSIRGVKEELGKVTITESFTLQPFSSQIGKLGQGIIQATVITKWDGQISNLEPDKGKHVWVNRDKVMETLTVNESKHLFWMALAGLGILKAEDFLKAPEMRLPR